MITAPLDPEIRPEDLPPIPPICSEQTALKVFTHRSVFARPTHVFEDAPGDPAPDNETLEHLGDSVLGLCVTSLIREMYPCLRVGPATKIRAIVVGNPTLASISVQYKLPELLQLHPAQAITLRASTNIQADVFESYVGGLYITEGLQVVKTWLSALFQPYVALAYRVIRTEYGLPPESPPRTQLAHFQSNQTYPNTPPAAPQQAYPNPLPPSSHQAYPNLLTQPSPQAYPNLLSTSTPRIGPPTPYSPAPRGVTTGHLSLFNQYLQQHAKYVEWVWVESVVVSGQATPIWAVRAMVDKRCLGRGKATTKKAAKNEAAKEALLTLGVYGMT